MSKNVGLFFGLCFIGCERAPRQVAGVVGLCFAWLNLNLDFQFIWLGVVVGEFSWQLPRLHLEFVIAVNEPLFSCTGHGGERGGEWLSLGLGYRIPDFS